MHTHATHACVNACVNACIRRLASTRGRTRQVPPPLHGLHICMHAAHGEVQYMSAAERAAHTFRSMGPGRRVQGSLDDERWSSLCCRRLLCCQALTQTHSPGRSLSTTALHLCTHPGRTLHPGPTRFSCTDSGLCFRAQCSDSTREYGRVFCLTTGARLAKRSVVSVLQRAPLSSGNVVRSPFT